MIFLWRMEFEEGFYQGNKEIFHIYKYKQIWIARSRGDSLINLSRIPEFFKNKNLKKIDPEEYISQAKSNIKFIQFSKEALKQLKESKKLNEFGSIARDLEISLGSDLDKS